MAVLRGQCNGGRGRLVYFPPMKLPGWFSAVTAYSVSERGLIGLCFMCGEYVVKRCKGYASLPLLVGYAPMCTASRARGILPINQDVGILIDQGYIYFHPTSPTSNCLLKSCVEHNQSAACNTAPQELDLQANEIRAGIPVNTGSTLLAFALALALLMTLSGALRLWNQNGVSLLSNTWYSWLALGVIAVAGLTTSFVRHAAIKVDSYGFALGLVVLFVSDWLTRSYNLFQGPLIRGEILLAAALCFCLLPHLGHRFWLTVLCLASAVLIYAFFDESDGRLLFSDDHSVFLYRLMLLKEKFPAIPFYDPFWNAGTDARDFFATGALAVFFCFSPLIYLFEPTAVYNVIIALLLFVFVPLCTCLSGLLLRKPRACVAISGILALCCSLTWYRWGLKYGTLGFITASALIPLNLAFAAILLDRKRQFKGFEAIGCTVSGTLMLLWSPTGLVFLPVIGLGILNLRRVLKKRFVTMICIALLLINLPWVTLFVKVSKVGSFLSSEKPSYSEMHTSEAVATQYRHKASGLNLERSLEVVRDAGAPTHPVLLLLAIPALLLLRTGCERRIYTGTVAWLFVMGAILSPLKPQLELDRLLVVLALVLAMPVAGLVWRMIEECRDRASLWRTACTCLILGFICVGPFCVSAISYNRTIEQYAFAEPEVDRLAAIIRENAGTGRTMFSGFVLHELSSGHLAPLTVFTGKPLLASSQVHNRWKYTDIIPKEFLARGPSGIYEYLSLMNVSLVVAHEQTWLDFFKKRSDDFEWIASAGKFAVFRYIHTPDSYFYTGSGKLLEFERDRVRLRITSKEAILKLHWYNWLRASDCSIASKNVSTELNFIKLSNCTPGTEIMIDSHSPLHRLLSN